MLSDNIRKLRKLIGLKQSELAEKTGVHQKDISRWENGERIPNATSLSKLAKALQCTLDDLIIEGE